MKNETSEVDFLKYREGKRPFPLFLKVAWTVFFVFVAVYLVRYALPDLRAWLAR